MKYPRLILKHKKEESLARRHPWVFSGAVARAEGQAEEGDIVDVYTAGGDFAARGHCQIGSITVRVLTFEQEEIDTAWWERAIRGAYLAREALGLADSAETTCYRLVHGEGDGLPGLVVDVYGSTAVVQCHSVGMFLARGQIADALRMVYGDRLEAVYDKSSQTVPYNAGLDTADGYLWRAAGEVKQKDNVVSENGLKFLINWERGQKTGFFIDQRENRELVRRYARGRRVLNTFCYTGGFSVYALSGGAVQVDSVDSSALALELCGRNVAENFGTGAPHTTIDTDAVEYLKHIDEGYDMIILDPPAFAKHQKALGNALQGYKRLNARAMSKIKPGGLLFTFSCSQAVGRDQFRTAVFTAAAIAGRRVRIIHQLTQGPDHPVNIYHPEGEYLKGLVLYVE